MNYLPVVGYEGLYEVNEFGQVRSIDRIILASLKEFLIKFHSFLQK